MIQKRTFVVSRVHFVDSFTLSPKRPVDSVLVAAAVVVVAVPHNHTCLDHIISNSTQGP